MSSTRRRFLESSALGLAVPFLGNLSGQTSQGERANLPQETGPLPFDESVLQFWTSKVSQPYRDYQKHITPKKVSQTQPEDSTFVFYSKETGFTLAGDIDPATLKPDDPKNKFPDTGDVNVQVHVERFRPAGKDLDNLNNLETGTLRIDLKQTEKLPQLPEALAWTAMSTLIAGKKGKGGTPLTDPNKDNTRAFDPGTAWGQFQTVPLPGGMGFWSWNFFMKKRQGFWGQLLDHLFQVLHTSEPYLPLLGIPGIAVSGLTYVNNILGAVQAQGDSKWLFQGLDTAVCATKDSIGEVGGPDAAKVVLTTGTYLIVRNSSVSQLKDLVIQDGLVVPPNTKQLDVFDAAKNTLKDQSYLTISVSVKSGSGKKAANSGAKPSSPASEPNPKPK
jgi:hypothetical protein